MVTDMFGIILEDLGKEFGLIDLHPDANNACLLKMKAGVSVQLEIDSSGDFLILGCKLGTPPPGRYRENLFREALKCNDLPSPLHGILSYSKKADQMVLYSKIVLKDLAAKDLSAEIKLFTEKAVIWAKALEHGDIPLQDLSGAGGSRGGMFGL